MYIFGVFFFFLNKDRQISRRKVAHLENKDKNIFEKRGRRIKTPGQTMNSCSSYTLRTKQEIIGFIVNKRI
jgi:hypothetical protein